MVGAIADTLISRNLVKTAIEWLEEVEETSYDEEILDVHAILSSLLTTAGVTAAQAGDTIEAQRRWRRALNYNPGNANASHNLRHAGRY